MHVCMCVHACVWVGAMHCLCTSLSCLLRSTTVRPLALNAIHSPTISILQVGMNDRGLIQHWMGFTSLNLVMTYKLISLQWCIPLGSAMHKNEVVTDHNRVGRLVGHVTNCCRTLQGNLLCLQKYNTLPNLQCLLFMYNTLTMQHIAHTFVVTSNFLFG